MNTLASQQYQWVKSSRSALFDYCRTISKEDFVNANSAFGRGGSIRNLLVHTANTYQFWIANTCLQMNIGYTQYEDIQDIDSARLLFAQVDDFMDDFISRMDGLPHAIYTINGATSTAPPLKLFTHVVTHEYHHKGQILSISRHLGYTPIDTDIMR